MSSIGPTNEFIFYCYEPPGSGADEDIGTTGNENPADGAVGSAPPPFAQFASEEEMTRAKLEEAIRQAQLDQAMQKVREFSTRERGAQGGHYEKSDLGLSVDLSSRPSDTNHFWSDKENETLLHEVLRHVENNTTIQWSEISKTLQHPGFAHCTGTKCSERFRKVLYPLIVEDIWLTAEEEVIEQLVNERISLEDAKKQLPGRTEDEINRYMKHKPVEKCKKIRMKLLRLTLIAREYLGELRQRKSDLMRLLPPGKYR